MKFDLVEHTAANLDVYRMLYHRNQGETHRERFTCRPVHRQYGYDREMIRQFLIGVLDHIKPLHKLGRRPRPRGETIFWTHLSQGLGFHRDGIMREQQWVETEVQDELYYSLGN